MDQGWMYSTRRFPIWSLMRSGHNVLLVLLLVRLSESGEYVTKSPEDGKPNRTQKDRTIRTQPEHGCSMTYQRGCLYYSSFYMFHLPCRMTIMSLLSLSIWKPFTEAKPSLLFRIDAENR